METTGIHLKRYYATYGGRRSNEMLITFSRKDILFNKMCRGFLNRKGYCELYQSKEGDVIGLRPIHIHKDGVVKISPNSPHQGRNKICCRDFMKNTGIVETLDRMNKNSIPVKAIWNDKNKMFLIDLKPIKNGYKTITGF